MTPEQYVEYIEQKAIDLYAADGFLLAIYSDPKESWAADREEVRERYRQLARAADNPNRENVRKAMADFAAANPPMQFIQIPAPLTADEARHILETAAMEKRLK